MVRGIAWVWPKGQHEIYTSSEDQETGVTDTFSSLGDTFQRGVNPPGFVIHYTNSKSISAVEDIPYKEEQVLTT